MDFVPTIKTRARLKRHGAFAAALGVVTLSAGASAALAAPPPPPSAGSVLQQATPPASVLTPPKSVLLLPPSSAAQPLSATTMMTVSQLVVDGNHLLPTALLDKLLAPAKGQTMSLAALQTYADLITQAYHTHGYPIAYAYLPPQSIRDGVVRIAVVEPKYDQVQITGQSRLRESVVRHTVLAQPGMTVTSATLDRSLLLLNQTPGLQVEGSLIPGAQPQTTTLQIERHDQPLFTANVSENNDGNRYTGTYLTNATVTANDPFGYGSALAVNGISSQSGGLKAAGFTLLSPNIWNGLRAGAYGSAVFYGLGGKFAGLQQVGRETQLGADLTYPLVLQPDRQFNVRFDTISNSLSQTTHSTQDLSRQMIVIEQMTLDGAVQDGWGGITTASLALSHGQLKISPAAAKAIDASGPKAEGDFLVSQLRLGHTQTLPKGFTLSLNANGQISDKNLDSSQQIFLGGPYGVMSYPVGSGGGDEGYVLSASLDHPLRVPNLPGQLSASALAQNGAVWTNHTPYSGFTGQNRITESGVGVGLTYKCRRFSVDTDYVLPVGKSNAAGGDNVGNQFWFQLGSAF